MYALSHVRLSVTPWTVAQQVSLSMRFFRQEYWSGLPFPAPRDLPDPGIEPTSLMSPALAGRFFTTSATYWLPPSSLAAAPAEVLTTPDLLFLNGFLATFLTLSLSPSDAL